jgi:hypothetical protein
VTAAIAALPGRATAIVPPGYDPELFAGLLSGSGPLALIGGDLCPFVRPVRGGEHERNMSGGSLM